VPIIPIVCSSTSHLKLNKWDNGHIIVEMLPPISIEGYGKEDVRKLANVCREQMVEKLAELDAEVAELNAKK
jgi:1-acyl-sn-glycerol-3-phosphate acyltransferase